MNAVHSSFSITRLKVYLLRIATSNLCDEESADAAQGAQPSDAMGDYDPQYLRIDHTPAREAPRAHRREAAAMREYAGDVEAAPA